VHRADSIVFGQLIFATDWAGGIGNATMFFPSVLVLTNYVMLNLFVGMIMNNVSAKF